MLNLLMIAIGLSMDAFAVSTTNGMCVSRQYKRQSFFTRALVWSAMFGLFQGLMPMLGYFLGKTFASFISSIDHWIAFILLGFIGGKMAFETGSNSYLQALRRATKEALYMYLHVRVTNRDYADSIGDTTAVRHAFTTSVFGWRHLVALIDIVAVVLFALAVRGVVIDVKLRKAAKTEKKNS